MKPTIWVPLLQSVAGGLLVTALAWNIKRVRIRVARCVPFARKTNWARLAFVSSLAFAIAAFSLRVPASIAAPGPELESAIRLAANGHLTEAIESVQRILNRDPENAPAMANLCAFELEAARLAAAESTCLRAVALAPTSWLAQYNFACALALAARPTEAVDALRRALESVERDPRAGLSRVQLATRAADDAMFRTLRDRSDFNSLTRIH